MTTLYTVDVGRYSDRRTIGVVDETHKAVIEANDLLGGINEVVTFTAFTLNETPVCPAGHKPYEVHMYMDTGDSQVYEANLQEYLDRAAYDFTNGLEMVRHVLAKDEEHAAKIVNEMRAEIKASGIANRGTGVVD